MDTPVHITPVMFSDITGYSPDWWSNFWNSTNGKITGTVLVVVGIIALTILTAGVGTAVTAALGGGFWAAVAGGAAGGAISGAIFGAGISMATQGISSGYSNIDWGKVGIDTIIGVASGAAMGALFAAGGRALGLLGKSKWALRTMSNYSDDSVNFMFGSVGKEGSNLTIARFGQGFRLEAATKYGLHLHYKTLSVGLSVHRTLLMNAILCNTAGIASASIWQWLN